MKHRVWTCKIAIDENAELPPGFDSPPRQAAMRAVEAHGFDILACFSGWGGELDEAEVEVVEQPDAREE